MDIELVIFCEHVRENLNYDFENFMEMNKLLSDAYGLDVILDLEAKVLPNGRLDVNEHILSQVSLIGIAEHSFPSDIELYYKSMISVFNMVDYESLLKVWVHPDRFKKIRPNQFECGNRYPGEAIDRSISQWSFY